MRAQSWRNLFDPATGFLRAKRNGAFVAPFDPAEVNGDYTEANAWQYALFVPQDMDALLAAHGGRAGLEALPRSRSSPPRPRRRAATRPTSPA